MEDIEIFFDFLEKEFPEKLIYKEKFEIYYKKLKEENKRINLVSKNDVNFIARKHFLDSILISNFIEEEKITDIGTGGGFPGVIISILNPHKYVYAIERNLKKAIFLKEIKIILNLKNIEIIREDIINMEEIKGDAFISKGANYKKIIEILKRKKIKGKNFYAILPLKENIENTYIIKNPILKKGFRILKIKI
jgi:16S rRNA (guanine527-N7)-methyltransferase